MTVALWSILLASAVLAFGLCLLLAPLARRFGQVDHPSARKVHSSPVPLVGGVAIYVAMTIMIMNRPQETNMAPMLLAGGLMVLTGLVDDRKELSAVFRLIAGISACCVMIFASGIVLTDFGNLMWDGLFSLGWLSVPLTLFAALGVINAFNMIDGVDGLSSTIFIIAASAMAVMALGAGHGNNVQLLIIAIGAVFGYFLLNARLPWNPRARVFMGDAGSGFLGLFLAWQFIDLGGGDNRAFAPMTAVWLIGIPLFDTTRLIVARIKQGNSPFDADQHHLHHLFLKAGFSVKQTYLSITALVLLTTATGLAGHYLQWPEYLMFYAYLAYGFSYLYVMRRCWRDGRFLGRDVPL